MAMLSNLDLIRRVPLFSMLTQAQAESIAEGVVKRRYRRGELIVERGRKTNSLFILLTGRARVVTADARGSGMLILFHVTAGPDWADLAYSGLFEQMLRVVYRLIFLGVAEDRDLLHPPATPKAPATRLRAPHPKPFMRKLPFRRQQYAHSHTILAHFCRFSIFRGYPAGSYLLHWA